MDERPAKPGFEQIPLDLSRVPSVEQGLLDAAERYRAFIPIAKDAFGEGPEQPIFKEHLPFFSFINRASSLHAGIVSAIRESNPHAAFTLLRAYLELVVLVLYVIAHPDYIAALEKPISTLPPGTRKRFSELFEFAGNEMTGVRTAYALLNEMAHFGSTALWHPFTIEPEERRSIRFSTAPGWRNPDDARTALAMLQESDEAMVEVLHRYSARHLSPKVARHTAWKRSACALTAAAGGEVTEEPGEFATISKEVIDEVEAEGLVAWCHEHSAFEIADGVEPEQIEAWVERRLGKSDQ